MRRSSTVLLSVAAVLLAACGSSGDLTSDPATGPTTTTQTSPSGAAPTAADDPNDSGPAFPRGTAAQTAKNSGAWDLVLTDVRLGEHDGYDRIVLEFTGTGTPGWAVNYVDKAVLDGSGERVVLDGNAVLDIYASGTTYPESEGDYYDGPTQFGPEDGDNVVEVHVGGTFEGYTQVLAGIGGGPAGFRVFALTSPSRLVVDVVDATADER
jgi:hypothetical protein